MVQGFTKKSAAVRSDSRRNKPQMSTAKTTGQKIIAKKDAKIKQKMEDRIAAIATASGDGSKFKLVEASTRGLSDLDKRKGGKTKTPGSKVQAKNSEN
jgi:hypothetical protein